MTEYPAAHSLAAGLRQVWAEFSAFLRHPRLSQPSGLRAPGALGVIGAMAVLHVLVMLALVPVLSFWQIYGSVGAPSAFSAVPPTLLVPLVVIAAPVTEEVAFRGWLTGRPRALWLLLGAVFSLVPLLFVQSRPVLSGCLMLAGLVATLVGWFVLRRRSDVPGWFVRNYTLLFYGTGLGFGLLHMSNYDNPGLMTVPMVLPQLWCALALGFVRMQVGLPAAILLHALSNAIVLAIAMTGQ